MTNIIIEIKYQYHFVFFQQYGAIYGGIRGIEIKIIIEPLAMYSSFSFFPHSQNDLRIFILVLKRSKLDLAVFLFFQVK